MELKRGLSAETLSALSGAFFYHTWLVFIDWPSGAIRVHSGVGTILYEGYEWLGVGSFGGISLPQEASGMASFAAEFDIVGLPEEIQDYLDEPIRGRAVQVYGAVVSERAGNQLIGAPFELWSGYMDAMAFSISVSDGDGASALEYGLKLEARGGPTARAAAEIYHTAEDQEAKFTGDTAGRLTINAEAEGAKLTWPES